MPNKQVQMPTVDLDTPMTPKRAWVDGKFYASQLQSLAKSEHKKPDEEVDVIAAALVEALNQLLAFVPAEGEANLDDSLI